MPAAVAAAPAMLYVMPDNFTPAHRAQLVRSNKKLEQILGVTPSVVPIAPMRSPSTNRVHRSGRTLSCEGISKERASFKGRERGRLASIWPLNLKTGGSSSFEEVREPLTRVSIESRASTSASTSTTVSPTSPNDVSPTLPYHRDLTPRRTRSNKHRPPMLNLNRSNAYPTTVAERENNGVLDISPVTAPSAVLERVDVDSPLSPTFRVDLGQSHRHEEEDVLRDIINHPYRTCSTDTTSSIKKTKMNRLAKRFGTQPPLELVYPPSPTSRSRRDPKRYTLGLPPPQTLSFLEGDEEMVEKPNMWTSGDDSKVLQVIWNDVGDEQGRKVVMNKLRELRA